MRLTAFALIVALAVTLSAAGPSAASQAPPAPCMEDRPCFVWSTMGDRDRGIFTITGHFKVVNTTQYRILNRGFRIDWQRSPRLRGDGVRHNVQDY